MSSNDEAKKLAAMLDRLCADGSGHINVTADESARDGGFDITEQTQNSTDCCGGIWRAVFLRCTKELMIRRTNKWIWIITSFR